MARCWKNNVADHNTEVGILVYTDDETSSGYSATLDNQHRQRQNRYGLFSQIPTGGSGNRATQHRRQLLQRQLHDGRDPCRCPPPVSAPTARRAHARLRRLVEACPRCQSRPPNDQDGEVNCAHHRLHYSARAAMAVAVAAPLPSA